MLSLTAPGFRRGKFSVLFHDVAGTDLASIKSACEAVKTKGEIVNVAIWEKEIPFNPNWITFKESSYKSVLGYQREDFQAVIDNLTTGKY
jgi:threonine dehydrogenase-like Zn-dependent dehydrogenase